MIHCRQGLNQVIFKSYVKYDNSMLPLKSRRYNLLNLHIFINFLFQNPSFYVICVKVFCTKVQLLLLTIMYIFIWPWSPPQPPHWALFKLFKHFLLNLNVMLFILRNYLEELDFRVYFRETCSWFIFRNYLQASNS